MSVLVPSPSSSDTIIMCVHACMADGVEGGLYTLRRPIRWSHIFHLAIIQIIQRSEIKNL